MQNFEFTYIVRGVDSNDTHMEDRFYEAGCDDATIVLFSGALALCFDREAENFQSAVISAYSDILTAGARPFRFEPDFLVGQSEIAKRANVTRASVSNYVSGKRLEHFPPPVALVSTPSPLWDWVEVSSWLYMNDIIDVQNVFEARLSRIVNRFIREHDEIAHANILESEIEDHAFEPVEAIYA